MYASLRKQNRLVSLKADSKNHGMLITAVDPGRKESSAGDPDELAAIERAMKRGDPLFFVRHVNGTVYDVMTNEQNARKYLAAKVESTPHGYANIRLYCRKAGLLMRLK